MENKLITVTSPLLPNLDEFHELLKQIWDSKWITNSKPPIQRHAFQNHYTPRLVCEQKIA